MAVGDHRAIPVESNGMDKTPPAGSLGAFGPGPSSSNTRSARTSANALSLVEYVQFAPSQYAIPVNSDPTTNCHPAQSVEVAAPLPSTSKLSNARPVPVILPSVVHV